MCDGIDESIRDYVHAAALMFLYRTNGMVVGSDEFLIAFDAFGAELADLVEIAEKPATITFVTRREVAS